VTRDRARKKAVRARMAATGEPYSAAARQLGAAGPPAAPAGPADFAARVNSTLAAPWARVEVRVDREMTRLRERPARRPLLPRPVARLARSAADAALKRISSGEMDLAGLREVFTENFRHLAGTGFVEPAAGRYQIDFGGYAEMRFGGEYYGGVPGRPLRANHHSKPPEEPAQEPLALLRTLRDAASVRPAGHETVRGTPCQVVAVQAGPDECTVWIDGEHVRRIQSRWTSSGEYGSAFIVQTFEFWDFGAGPGPADWTRLPDFRAAQAAR
jgi:hypothetical protein